MNRPENFEVVTPERLAELLYKERVLEALEGAGVDNWEGYEEALMDLREEAP